MSEISRKRPSAIGMDPNELKTRLLVQPDVLSAKKPPALKAVKRRTMKEKQSTLQARLEPLPALSLYQRKKNEEILKTQATSQETDTGDTVYSRRPKQRKLDPLPAPVLPQLPTDLVEQQRTLSALRVGHAPSPPSNVTSAGIPRSYSSPIKKPTQSTLYLNTNPNMVVTKYSPPLETITNTLDIIDRLRKEPELGFLYLTVCTSNSSHYNPYDLRYYCTCTLYIHACMYVQ